MQSESPSAAAPYPHTTPLSSPFSVSDNPPSPLSTSQNVSRDTSTTPLSIPDTTRSPSSINTSTPHSPLTPANSSPRSFRSFSSQQRDSDSHSLLAVSPLSGNSPGGMSSHSRLSSGLSNTLSMASPTRSRPDNHSEQIATPVVGSTMPNALHDTPLAHAHTGSANLSLIHSSSPRAGSLTGRDHHNDLGMPMALHGSANGCVGDRSSPPQTAAEGSPAFVTQASNSTATAAALPPNSPLRSPISADIFASPKLFARSPTNAFSPTAPPVASSASTSRSSGTAFKSSQTSKGLTLDHDQLQSPTSAPFTTTSPAKAHPQTPATPGVAFGSPGAQNALSLSRQQQSETNPGASIGALADTSSGTDFRTPNVYINGLPPNFPEEELFKMTREFGMVVSVRTFTRHVCDKPSGYGFVLYETVDAAERCIEALRKYRNLHPSFSKQVHKIPGTIYSSPTFQAVAGAHGVPADSFKARMEQLKDTASTNLYMEGLPPSIDEMTLSALVKPYKICSSRFFPTKLSNPPRMIAFVRLESRAAAEEIIERLHGRVIRGLDDSGARISVRFADTAEQRELRRTERTGRDGEQSPGRISMAQAALLNLKGGQVHPPQLSPLISPDLGVLQSGANISPLLAHARTPLSPSSLPLPQQQALLQQRMQELSLAGYDDFSANASPCLRQDPRITPRLAQIQDELFSLQQAQAQLQLKSGLGVGAGMGSAARADNGFTAMERMLLQAHAQHQQDQQLLEARAQVQTQQGLTGRGPSKRRLLDVLQPYTIEDDFHASAAVGADGAGRSTSGDSASIGQRQRNQTHMSNARTGDAPGLGQASHLRSTTMPSQYLNSRALDGSGGLTFGADRGPTTCTIGRNDGYSVANMNASNAFARKPSVQNLQSLNASTLPRTTSSTTTQSHGHGHGQGLGRGVVQEADVGGDEDGSQLLSPGLTFSPRTPATLSPATPFGGFFHTGESFDGSGVVGVGGKGLSMGHHDLNAKEATQNARGGVSMKGLHV
ncbi:hypothetical protein DAEQUDRAFT_85503 [Daedalea quercina L-15889]|uniref:RRM domain-containing protein n=1 Tax=Daedalea quercina L-15889 TaxID=1314783 RepID=A0A165L0C8_9APHY|nr:hypothetical protein DAEQUDRAFT_85503 [Daedalea quercina L-15889]